MLSWFAYAAGSAVLLVGLVMVILAVVGGADPRAVWLAAVIAWPVQLMAYAALLAGRRRGHGFVVGWASGMLLRLAAVGAVALWVTRGTAMDPASALLSLVGFLMVLVLLEPLFLRLAE